MKRSREHIERSRIRQGELAAGRIAADKLTATARFCGLHAQEPDIIDDAFLKGCIGVKRAFVVRDRRSLALAYGLARVSNIVKTRSGNVLSDRFTKKLADSPVNASWVSSDILAADNPDTITKPGPFSRTSATAQNRQRIPTGHGLRVAFQRAAPTRSQVCGPVLRAAPGGAEDRPAPAPLWPGISRPPTAASHGFRIPSPRQLSSHHFTHRQLACDSLVSESAS